MESRWTQLSLALSGILLIIGVHSVACAQDPLPSWNGGPAIQAIVAFVEKVTRAGGPDFVAPAERIAVFDNDGTLWVEQPLYTQLAFAIDRVKALAPQHPEWKENEPFKSILAGDNATALAGGETAIAQIVAATHAGMTTIEFEKAVRDWIADARHPRFDRPYTSLVYQPMLELLAYLRANGFQTYIVSGGGVEFMRPWTERVYGIPPQQVVGSRGKLRYEVRNGVPILLKLPEIDLVDDKAGKPVGIQQQIGRRPIAAFGNSDGDFEMLEWATSAEPGSSRPSFGLIVHHTDAEREFAYDRDSHVGRLDKALTEAPRRGWTVVSMKTDWNSIFPAAPPSTEPREDRISLTGSWRLVRLDDAPLPAGLEAPTLIVTGDGAVSGSTGVNRMSGRVTGAGPLFGPLATTRRAGPPAAMQLEARYLAALGEVDRLEGRDDGLKLFAGARLRLVYEAAR
jgi:heat shock protein HslJ